MNETKYWNYRQVHVATGMPLGTIYSLVSAKRIPHIRLGNRHVLFSQKEVIAWIERHRVNIETSHA